MQGRRSANGLLHMAGNSDVVKVPRLRESRQAPAPALHQSTGEGCTTAGIASAAVRHAQPLPRPTHWQPMKRGMKTRVFWRYVVLLACTCSTHTQKETPSCIRFLSNDSGSHGTSNTTDRCRPQQQGSCAACPPPLRPIFYHT